MTVKKIMTLVLMMLIGGYGAVQAQSTGTLSREEMVMEDATETEEETNKFLGLEWGLGIGVIGSLGGEAAVEKASIVEIPNNDGTTRIIHVEEEGDMRPRVFMEMHAFVLSRRAKKWREYQRGKAAARMADAMGTRRGNPNEQTTAPPPQAMTSPSTTTTTTTPTMTTTTVMREGRQASGTGTAMPAMPDPPLMGVGPFFALQGSDDEVINSLAVGVMWGFRRDPQKSNSLNIGVGVSFDPSVQVLAKDFKEGGTPPNHETAVRFKKEGRFGWAVMASFTF